METLHWDDVSVNPVIDPWVVAGKIVVTNVVPDCWNVTTTQ
jgi:hypothetical protein